MPLDSHSYLVSQGWGGKGTGLRQGAISRPLAIPQKKNLAGLGKDRDEAFPFWDHLFSAASKSIQIKCLSDDEEENGTSTNSSSNLNTSIKCTSTGIFSNRRPVDGIPATSGTNTPEITTQSRRLGLLATAKRDAAKRSLYSKFFRGLVLGPDTMIEEEKRLIASISQVFSANDSIAESVSVQETIKIQTADESVCVDLEVSKSFKKKRKSCETKESGDEKEKRERKRRRNEEKKEKAEKAERHATEKRHKKKHKGDTEAGSLGRPSGKATDKCESQADCKRREKEEKKRLKTLEKAQPKDAKTHSDHGSKSLQTQTSGKQTKLEETCNVTTPEVLVEPKKRKRKRKHVDAE